MHPRVAIFTLPLLLPEGMLACKEEVTLRAEERQPRLPSRLRGRSLITLAAGVNTAVYTSGSAVCTRLAKVPLAAPRPRRVMNGTAQAREQQQRGEGGSQ